MLQALDAITGAAMPHSGAALWLGRMVYRRMRRDLAFHV